MCACLFGAIGHTGHVGGNLAQARAILLQPLACHDGEHLGSIVSHSVARKHTHLSQELLDIAVEVIVSEFELRHDVVRLLSQRHVGEGP